MSGQVSAHIIPIPIPLYILNNENFCRYDSVEHQRRKQNVQSCIQETGTYTQTYEELEFGARLAWRNAPRCIGRIQWNNLKVN